MENKQINIIDELSEFRSCLKDFFVIRKKIIAGKTPTPEEYETLNSLFDRISIGAGKYSPLIEDVTGAKLIQTNAGPQDLWSWALSKLANPIVITAIDNCISATSRTIGAIENDIANGKRDPITGKIIKIIKKDKRLANKPDISDPVIVFNSLKFHPKIIEVSKSLFEHAHYAQAIFEAFKAVEIFVKEKSGCDAYGRNLMATAFNEEKPKIIVPEGGVFDKDVQEGFKLLFMGASQGIRDTKAHKDIIQKDPYITLEYLGFASFLLKRISNWEVGTI